MKKVNYLFIILGFCLFIPKVYAFTYDFNTSVNNTSVKSGTATEIKVSLNNVQGTSMGIAICSVDISLDDSIVLNSDIRTLNSWTMTRGDFYLFDTGNSVFNSSDMFVIPVKVNGNGSVKLRSIECSDGETIESIGDKSINFTVYSDTGNNQNNNLNNNSNQNNNGQGNSSNNNNSNNNVVKDSNCDLVSVSINGKEVADFDSSVTEYMVKIDRFDELVVEPLLASDKASFTINKSDDNSRVSINTLAEDGSSKTYTILIEQNEEIDDKQNNKNYYTLIFIIVICVLVVLNVFRIIKNKKK